MSNRTRSEFAERVRTQRARLRRKQREVAQAAGITASYLSRIEAGRVDPRYSVAQRLLEVLGLESVPNPEVSEDRLVE